MRAQLYRLVVICLAGILFIPMRVIAEASVSPQYLDRKVELEFANPDGGRTPRISAEVALTPQERNKGLMARMDVTGLHGMLFVFPDVAPRSFWMKNTPLPLDMLFMAEDDTVACVHENTEPFSVSSRPCNKAGKFVLELRGGEAGKLGIKPGSQLKFLGEKPFASF